MNLKDVLFDVDVLVPNSIMPTIKIRWANQIVRQLYRDLPMPNAVYPFLVQPGTQIYELPADCQTDNITSVSIGGNDYERVYEKDIDLPTFFWTIVAGGFIINPAPIETSDGSLYYNPTPPDLTEKDLKKYFSLPVDYAQLLVDGVASRVAKAENDLKAADYHKSVFDELLRKARQDLTKNEVHSVRMEYGFF